MIVLVALVAGTAVASPFFVHRGSSGNLFWMVSTHDMVQHLAVMKDFDKVLRAGTLYPRWLPDINNGYGLPWMNFYPPGFYYVASLVNAILKDWVVTLYVISVLGFAASGLAFYWLARAFYGRAASAIAALVYMVLPYHVLNLYWQGAMPQFLGFIFLPLTLLFAYRVGARGRGRDYAGLAFFYGAYLMTHAPVSFLMTYTLAFYGLVWAAKERDWKIAFRIAIGMAIGLALGAIYWLPAAIEAKNIQEHFSAIFPYHNGYITLLPVRGFGNLINQSFALQSLTIILATLIIRALNRPAGGFRPSSQTGEQEPTSLRHTRLWIVMAAATTFMSTSFSIYISKLLPKIQVATFPWRWLAISSLFTALVVGAAIDRLRERSDLTAIRRWAYAAGIAALIGWNLAVTVQGVIGGALLNPRMDLAASYLEGGFSPKDSTLPQNLPDTEPVLIHPENGASEIIRWEPRHREIAVRVDQLSELRLKTYNFPGWTAQIDDQKAPLLGDKDGVQVISVPAGRHKVETDFVDTPPRRIGAVLFALGLVTILTLTIVDYARRRSSEIGEPDREEPRGIAGREAHGDDASDEFRRRAKVAVVSLAVIAVVIAGLLVTRWFISAGKPLSGRNPNSSTTDPTNATGRTNVGVGSEVRLHVEGLTSIPVAVDEKALDELMNALPAGNTERMDELIQSGRVFQVDNDTSVRIVEAGFAKIKVRVIEGSLVMFEGWVSERWVR